MRRVLFLVRKELQELVHNTRLLPVLILPPVVQLILLGYATNLDTKHVPLLVADGDRTPLSRELVMRFDGSAYFTVVGTVTSAGEVTPWLERGAAWMALVIPHGYAADIGAGRPAAVQILADGMRVLGLMTWSNEGSHTICRLARPTATAVSVCRLSALTNISPGIDTRAANSCAEATLLASRVRMG